MHSNIKWFTYLFTMRVNTVIVLYVYESLLPSAANNEWLYAPYVQPDRTRRFMENRSPFSAPPEYSNPLLLRLNNVAVDLIFESSTQQWFTENESHSVSV